MSKKIIAPEVSIGQIWSRRSDSSQVVVCRVNHPLVLSLRDFDKRVAEIRNLSVSDTSFQWPVGPPTYPLLENFSKYYQYVGIRNPNRLDILQEISGEDMLKMFIVSGLSYHGDLKSVFLDTWRPVHGKKPVNDPRSPIRFTKKFWKVYKIVGHLSDEEYEDLYYPRNRRH